MKIPILVALFVAVVCLSTAEVFGQGGPKSREEAQALAASLKYQQGQIVLHNVTLPYDVLNLTLSQIGINTVAIPAFNVS